MSLYIPTDFGLLGTHVTWEDVEVALQAALGTTAHFGGNKTVINIAEMKGFLSRIALIEPDWVRSNTEDDDSMEPKLPEKLVVKIASQLALIEIAQLTGNKSLEEEKIPQMFPMTKSMHNREVGVYEMLEREGNGRVPHAKMYAAKSFGDEDDGDLKAFMIFDYITNRPSSLLECIPAEKIHRVIRGIAGFSSLGEKLPEHQLSFVGGSEFWDHVIKEFQDKEGSERTAALLRGTFPAESQEEVEKMLDIFGNVFTKPNVLEKFATCPEFLNHKRVLGHCDLWNSNLLFNQDLDFKAFVDFQTVSWCTPGLDLSRLFSCVLSKKERREQKDALLREYYTAFVAELDGKPAPYTLDQLFDSYSLFYPFMAMIILPGMASQMAHEKVEDQEVMDKMIGLMEDVITTHAENMLKFPAFFE